MNVDVHECDGRYGEMVLRVPSGLIESTEDEIANWMATYIQQLSTWEIVKDRIKARKGMEESVEKTRGRLQNFNDPNWIRRQIEALQSKLESESSELEAISRDIDYLISDLDIPFVENEGWVEKHLEYLERK